MEDYKAAAIANIIGYRIVQTDNFGMAGELPGHDERFLLWSMPKERCEQIARILNDESGDMGSWFYKVEPYDYQLREFQP